MAMLHQNLAREVVQAYLVYALLAVWREIDDELKVDTHVTCWWRRSLILAYRITMRDLHK